MPYVGVRLPVELEGSVLFVNERRGPLIVTDGRHNFLAEVHVVEAKRNPVALEELGSQVRRCPLGVCIPTSEEPAGGGAPEVHRDRPLVLVITVVIENGLLSTNPQTEGREWLVHRSSLALSDPIRHVLTTLIVVPPIVIGSRGEERPNITPKRRNRLLATHDRHEQRGKDKERDKAVSHPRKVPRSRTMQRRRFRSIRHNESPESTGSTAKAACISGGRLTT